VISTLDGLSLGESRESVLVLHVDRQSQSVVNKTDMSRWYCDRCGSALKNRICSNKYRDKDGKRCSDYPTTAKRFPPIDTWLIFGEEPETPLRINQRREVVR